MYSTLPAGCIYNPERGRILVNGSHRGGQTGIGEHDIASDSIIESEFGMSVRGEDGEEDQPGLAQARTFGDETI
jgi:hypothetical protein